ncbi:MAG: response regulator transcription factor [Nibricoccus sp.]
MKTTAQKPIRLMLVDDHIVMRMGLASATNGQPDMKVVAEAECGETAIDAYRKSQPDVVVMDLRMGKFGGLAAIKQLKAEFGAVKVLVFSNYASGEEMFQAFKAGASGFVVKEMALERLLEAIRQVNRGEQYLPPEISVRMTSRMFSNLSPRELEVLNLVGKGMSNKEIGSMLGLTEGTVKVHLTNILDKLDVSDRTQAIISAIKRGIIQLE